MRAWWRRRPAQNDVRYVSSTRLPALVPDPSVARMVDGTLGSPPESGRSVHRLGGFVMRRWLRPPSLSTAIALLALAVAGTGTAVAATGTIVNIADGTDSSRVAHVDAAGNLLV